MDAWLHVSAHCSDAATFSNLRLLHRGLNGSCTVKKAIQLDCRRFYTQEAGWQLSLSRAHAEWALFFGDGDDLPAGYIRAGWSAYRVVRPLWLDWREGICPTPSWIRKPVPRSHISEQVAFLLGKGAPSHGIVAFAPIAVGKEFLPKFYSFLDLEGRSDFLFQSANAGRLENVDFILKRGSVTVLAGYAIQLLALDRDDGRLMTVIVHHKDSSMASVLEELLWSCEQRGLVRCATAVACRLDAI